MRPFLRAFLALVCLAVPAFPQAPSTPSIDRVGISDTGTRPYGNYDGVREKVNLQNNNLTMTVPLVDLPGRNGFNLTLGLQYDSSIWRLQNMWVDAGAPFWVTRWAISQKYPAVAPGWGFNWPTIIGSSHVLYGVGAYGYQYSSCEGETTVTLQDGSKHAFRNNPMCAGTPSQENPVMDTEDSDGMQLNTQDYPGEIVVSLRNGTKIFFGTYGTGGAENDLGGSQATPGLAEKIVDINGNTISMQFINGDMVFSDTLGRHVTANANGVTYTDVNGDSRFIQFSYSSHAFAQAPPFPTSNSEISMNAGQSYLMGHLEKVSVNWNTPEVQVYGFQYSDMGQLSKITYPHGGCTSFDYGIQGRMVSQPLPQGVSGIDQPASLAINLVTPQSTPGSYGPSPLFAGFPGVIAKHVGSQGVCDASSATTLYNGAGTVSNDEMSVTFPDLSVEKHFFSSSSLSAMDWERTAGAHELEVDTLNKNGVMTKKVLTEWTGSATWDLPKTVTTIYNPSTSNIVTKTAYTYHKIDALYQSSVYNTYGSLTNPVAVPAVVIHDRPLDAPESQTTYDFGAGSAGSILQTVMKQYLDHPESAHRLMGLVTGVVTSDGSQAFKAKIEYDGVLPQALTAAALTPMGNTPRGNVTRFSRCLSVTTSTDLTQCGTWSSTSYVYDDAGNMLSMSDALSHSTTFDWTDAWDGSNCTPPSTSYAYVTKITNALSEYVSAKYRPCTGARSYLEDFNRQPTSYQFDSLSRIKHVLLPIGEETIEYNDADRTVKFTTPMNGAGDTLVHRTSYDGIGRHTLTEVLSDPDGTMTTRMDYDGMDRLVSQTNPFRGAYSSSVPSVGFTYDEQGRKTITTQQDSSVATTDYSAFPCVRTTDESQVARVQCSDALGRLVDVYEDPDHSNLHTQYTYDVAGNLRSVNQTGVAGAEAPRVRSFTYDGASRLLTSVNPETGPVCYGTVAGLGVPAADASNCSTSDGYDLAGNLRHKTDARGVRVNYDYDAVNRLTTKSYEGAPGNPGDIAAATPPAHFVYPAVGSAPANGIGRVMQEWTGSGTNHETERNLTYDVLGRVSLDTQCPSASLCAANPFSGGSPSPFAFHYWFDNVGNVTRSEDGISQTNFVYTPDTAGRLKTVTSVWDDATHPGTLFAPIVGTPQYGPAGLEAAVMGASTITNRTAFTQVRTYDNRLRVTSETDTASSGPTSARGSSGTITITGSEPAPTTSLGSPGVGSITIRGEDNTHQACVSGPRGISHCVNFPDQGNFSIILSSPTDTFTAMVGFAGDTSASLAQALTDSLNDTSVAAPLVSATLVDCTPPSDPLDPLPVNALGCSRIDMTALTNGASTNYSISVLVDDFDVPGAADYWWQLSGSTMTGGADNGQTVYDTGTVTVNSSLATATWQAGSTAASIAADLVTSLNASGLVTATLSGNPAPNTASISVSSGGTGSASNWLLACLATDTAGQTAAFAIGCNGMSGGADAASGGNTVYSYSIPAPGPNSGYAPNGNLLSVTDSVMGTWTYQYDNLNRLKQGNATANSATNYAPYGTGQLNWTYDSFGNFKGQGFSGAGGSATVAQSNFNYETSQNNRIDNEDYDAAGNKTYTTANHNVRLYYDAEGRVYSVNNETFYVYDAEGRRVAKKGLTGATNVYLLGLNGEQVTELDGTGQWLHTNVTAGSELVTYDAAGVHFHFTDWLGSRRMQASGTGDLQEYCQSLPFGDSVNCFASNGATITPGGRGLDTTEHHFTGKERDAESGLDYFGARYYASSLGRWMSPDVPFADQHSEDPQSFNLYSYVRNNPLRLVDPTGNGATPANSWQMRVLLDHLFQGPRDALIASPNSSPRELEKMFDSGKSFDPRVYGAVAESVAVSFLQTAPQMNQQSFTYQPQDLASFGVHPDIKWVNANNTVLQDGSIVRANVPMYLEVKAVSGADNAKAYSYLMTGAAQTAATADALAKVGQGGVAAMVVDAKTWGSLSNQQQANIRSAAGAGNVLQIYGLNSGTTARVNGIGRMYHWMKDHL